MDTCWLPFCWRVYIPWCTDKHYFCIGSSGTSPSRYSWRHHSVVQLVVVFSQKSGFVCSMLFPVLVSESNHYYKHICLCRYIDCIALCIASNHCIVRQSQQLEKNNEERYWKHSTFYGTVVNKTLPIWSNQSAYWVNKFNSKVYYSTLL